MQVPSASEGGDDRPTFFELVAADKLVPSLRAALVYSVGVLVSRRPSLARLLDHEDEAFAVFMLLVEWHSFATSDGSMAEGLYGLQRSRVRQDTSATKTKSGAVSSTSQARGPRRNTRLTRSQKVASVLLLAGVPFVREKLDKLYEKLASARGLAHITGEAAIAGAILGTNIPPRTSGTSEDFGDDSLGVRANVSNASASAPTSRRAAETQTEASARRTDGLVNASSHSAGVFTGGVADDAFLTVATARASAENTFVTVYPYAHAAMEAATLVCWMRFLLSGAASHGLGLFLINAKVTRASVAEASQRRVELETNRAAQIRRMRGVTSSAQVIPGVVLPVVPAFLVRILAPRFYQMRNFLVDYAQGGLMTAVVGFKLMEWWYGTAEEAVVGGQARLPVPPPPPVPPPHRDGIPPAIEPGQVRPCAFPKSRHTVSSPSLSTLVSVNGSTSHY